MITPKELGELVASRREELNLSQEDLVHHLRLLGVKVSKGTISNLERGQSPLPRIDTAQALEQVLGIDLAAEKMTA